MVGAHKGRRREVDFALEMSAAEDGEAPMTAKPCCDDRVERVNDIIFQEWYSTRLLIGLLVAVYPLGLLALIALGGEVPIEVNLYANAGGYVYGKWLF